jgi:hypothetical protein
MKQLLLYISLLLIACNPVSKAVKTFEKHPYEAVAYCAMRFPVRDSILVRDSVSYDTIYKDGEIIKIPIPYAVYDTSGRPAYVEAPCPPHRTITKIVRRDSLIIRRDIAKETVLKNANDDCYLNVVKKEKRITELEDDYTGMKKKRNWWRIACLATWTLIGLGIVWRIKSKLLV